MADFQMVSNAKLKFMDQRDLPGEKMYVLLNRSKLRKSFPHFVSYFSGAFLCTRRDCARARENIAMRRINLIYEFRVMAVQILLFIV